MAYVTTEDRCSNCGEPLRNAETARLNWQEKACELQKQLAEAQANAKYWVEQHGIEAGKRGQCEHELDEARGNLAGQMERIERERDEAQAALFNMQSLANADCPKCDRLRKALEEIAAIDPRWTRMQIAIDIANKGLKGQP